MTTTSERPVGEWKLVPVEPLPEMIGAWYRVKNGHHFHDEAPPTDNSDYAAYRAMLASAPASPAIGVQAATGLSEETQCQLDAIDEAIRAGAMAGNMIVGSALHPAPEAASAGAAGEIDWKKAFAAQSRKLQAVLHIPGVREELAKLVWSSDTAPSPKGVSDGVREAFSGTDDRDTELEAAAREAGWALMELVNSIDWTKRDQVSEIITRLGAALSQEPVPATAEERASSKEGA